jgi:multidrug efflux pump subunit AcrA (membrane-fusion protein)
MSTALSNARNQESIFLLPLWRTIGRTLGWFRGRRLAIAIGILAAVGVLIGALSVVPWEYRFEATGRAMPSEQHDIFAPWDGNVIDVRVKNGQLVKKDEIVLVLRSDDLDTELLAAKNMASEAKNKLINLEQQRSEADNSGDRQEVTRIDTEIATTKAQLIGANEKAAMYEKRIEALQVRSPIEGVVATFQVKQNLLDRPVRRGDRLIEVMKVDGPWRLELDAPEYRMGHLQKAVIAKSGSTATPGQPALRQKLSEAEQLTVDYIAATDVGNRKQGKLAEIATRSNESQKEGSTIVELYVDINADDLPGRRIGAEVTAKIHCGKRSLGYVLFGDVWEFILRKVWW